MDWTFIEPIVYLAWLAGAVAFVLGLIRMNSPATARNGNLLSAGGMALAILATAVLLLVKPENATRGRGDPGFNAVGWLVILAGIALGGGFGLYTARTVKMTAMPQLVSLFNAVGGGAAALIAIDEYLKFAAHNEVPGLQVNVATVLDIVIGSITFTGSLIASGKLHGPQITPSRPVMIPGGQLVTAALALITVVAAAYLSGRQRQPPGDAGHPGRRADLRRHDDAADRRRRHAGRHLAAQLVHGHGRRDGGLRAREPGPDHRRRARRCVGRDPDQADGRRHEPVRPEHHDRRVRWGRRHRRGRAVAAGGCVRELGMDDAAIQLAYAQSVIVVPGYGLAVAQAQHAVRELAELLESRGVDVKYAIHPVAGRMPGHMNVLLAEANVPYPQLKEMEDINPEFDRCDVALVIGANDVTNPAARRPGSPVSGMPILDVDHSKNIIVMKRSMGRGYAGIDNELYVNPKTGMLFADAKAGLADLISAVKAL